jgi:hypothetical protein
VLVVFGVGGIVGGGSGSGGGGKRVHLVDHSTEILIPWLFQPPPPRTLVDCGVIEVSDLVVRANSTAQRQMVRVTYPPLKPKMCPKSPQKV